MESEDVPILRLILLGLYSDATVIWPGELGASRSGLPAAVSSVGRPSFKRRRARLNFPVLDCAMPR